MSGGSSAAIPRPISSTGRPSGQLNAITCPVACTPASVRPAPSTRIRRPPLKVESADSSSPWTVRLPGCTWNPAKSVPSYSTRARYRTGPPSRATCLRTVLPCAALHQLELDDGRRVTSALAELDQPRVAGSAVPVPGRELVHQLVHHERLVGQLGDDPPPRGERALSREGDDPLDLASHLLGARLRGPDLLVPQHRYHEVLVEGLAGTGLAAQLAA